MRRCASTRCAPSLSMKRRSRKRVAADVVDEAAEDESVPARAEQRREERGGRPRFGTEEGEEGAARGRRRRRRRGRGGGHGGEQLAPGAEQPSDEGLAFMAAIEGAPARPPRGDPNVKAAAAAGMSAGLNARPIAGLDAGGAPRRSRTNSAILPPSSRLTEAKRKWRPLSRRAKRICRTSRPRR